jgi:hypothetical protein
VVHVALQKPVTFVDYLCSFSLRKSHFTRYFLHRHILVGTIKVLNYMMLLLGYIARLSEKKSVSALYLCESCNIDFQCILGEYMDLLLMKIICIKIYFSPMLPKS